MSAQIYLVHVLTFFVYKSEGFTAIAHSLTQETLKMALLYIFLLVAVSSFAESSSASQQNSILPFIISPAVGACNCPCGGSGQWTTIANFNFGDPDVACPSGFTLITEPVRGCGRAPGEAGTCKSVVFSSGGQSYSCVWKSECLSERVN